ncbi:kinase-like protein [Trichoderma austrokoningii]
MGQFISSLLPLRFRLWLGRQLYEPFTSGVVRVSRHRIIKGPCGPPEIEAMQYIADNTAIPIPQIYAIHTTPDKQIYIEMEYIEGKSLYTAWKVEGLSQEQKTAIWADIKHYVSILRELQPPAEHLVASALQNPAYDVRIGARFFGPFSHREFHSLTQSHLRMEDVAIALGEEVEKVHTTSYRTCFTHGDLIPRNIIVRNGRVAAIIDWAFAGWYPEYWEFTKGHYDFFPKEDWYKHFCQEMPSYKMELMAEQALWEMIPEPGTPETFYREGVVRKVPGSMPSATWQEARADHPVEDLWSVVLSSRRFASET